MYEMQKNEIRMYFTDKPSQYTPLNDGCDLWL